MYEALHNYLVLHKQLNLPGIGMLRLEQEPARLDFIEKTLHSPKPAIHFLTDTPAPARHFYQYLSRWFSFEETDTIRRFNEFVFDLKSDIAGKGKAILPGIGTIAKNQAGAYTFQTEDIAVEQYFPSIRAERVLRENAEHNIRVGEDEKTSTQMQELLSEKPQSQRWWIAAVILAAAGIAVIVYYHLTH
ncbi:hypothetical protein [Foetidibacter luteolus]|uniref:hypothetical protein n=1 Tax=Foetidibacter luteolus TaxID=2608880 RepID=UPI00129B6F6A|nr:hypothetical protein [Foetidibacter luteolus]